MVEKTSNFSVQNLNNYCLFIADGYRIDISAFYLSDKLGWPNRAQLYFTLHVVMRKKINNAININVNMEFFVFSKI